MTRYMPPEGEEPPLGSFYMGRMQPPPPPPRRQLPKGLVAGVVAFCFIGIIWYAYPQGDEKYDVSDIPLIAADTSPYKFKPEDPGGLEVLHQDSTVFNPIERRIGDAVEILMPLPEEPMDKTAAIEAAKAKAPINAAEPKLNLNMQLQPLGKGMEKIVNAENRKPSDKPPANIDAAEKPASVPKKEDKPKKEVKAQATVKEEKAEAVPQGAPPAEASPVYIRLGSYRNEGGANEDWKKLSGKYPQYLKNLQMRVLRTDLGSRGIFYRLEAGKLADMRAKQVCEAIKAGHSGGCMIIKP